MKNITIHLKNHNDPFSLGFCSFLLQAHCVNTRFKRKILVSDHEKCDIGLVNNDIDSSWVDASVVFSNAKPSYRKKEFFFPYLLNARNESLIADNFSCTISNKKKYNCVSIFNSHTNPIRKSMVPFLEEVCDVLIVDSIKIKVPSDLKESNPIIDSWEILRSSNFSFCPPGNISETYRFYESLKCRCIPIEFLERLSRIENISEKYGLNGNLKNIEKIKKMEYSENEVERL